MCKDSYQNKPDIDKILEIIKKKVLKGTHLPLTIKEIQAGYLSSLYFKDIYLYLAHNRLSSKKAAMRRVELLAEKYILLDSLLFKLITIPGKEAAMLAVPEILCRQNNYPVPLNFICRTSRSHKNISYD